METPKISCRCPTYGRVHVLEEAIFSFISQDYEEWSELVIVNDYPLQTLIFEHPKVKIINLKETFSTIGQKENFTIENCSGDVITVFDDDDVALPNHFSNIIKYWKEDTNILFWGNGAYYNEPRITALTKMGNSGMVYSKKAWEAIGKSPKINAGGDMILSNKIKALDYSKVIHANPPDEEVSWFYRWSLPQNGGVYHQSGLGVDDGTRPNVVIRNAQHVENLRKKGLIPTGEIILQPHWRHNYTQMLKDYIKK